MLAIIIPYYKLKYFEQTLQSVENQTDRRFMLYIGNDASPEDPGEIIERVLKTTRYEYFSYAENLGGKNLTEQWHRIISEIKEKQWLMILGDDDVLEPNVVAEFYKNLESIYNKGISMIKLGKEIIDENNNLIKQEPEFPQEYSAVQLTEDKFFGRRHNSLSEHIFRTDKVKQYGFKPFPLAWHSDDLALLEFADLGNFYFIGSAKVKVRISNDSISGQDNSDPRKSLATYQFVEYLLNNYNRLFSKEMTRLLVKRYREIIWKNGYPLHYDITKAFFEKGDFLLALKSVRMKQQLKKRQKHS